MVATKLYVTGGLGSRHSDEAIGDRYELPSERAYARPAPRSPPCSGRGGCSWRPAGAKYLDVFERVLYNAYAVGLSADGTAFFYDNPLQRRPDHEQRSGAEDGGEPLRRPWFGCPCCPPNIVRWMAQLGDHVAAERDGALLHRRLRRGHGSTPGDRADDGDGLPVGRRRAPRRRPGAGRAVRDHAARPGLGDAT